MSIEIIVLRFVHRKSKNLLSLVPFSIIFLVEFCVTIYSKTSFVLNLVLSTISAEIVAYFIHSILIFANILIKNQLLKYYSKFFSFTRLILP